AAIPGGPRPRLYVALRQVPARTRAHRHLQSLVLRRGLGRARASRGAGTSAAARGGRRQENLGSAARRHRAFRGLPDPTGNDHPQVLFASVAREQKKRFMQRLDRPHKHWKFSAADIRERGFWADYMHAFEEAIRATASPRAPWFVVPADNKWFTRLIVAAAIVETVEKLDLSYPKIDAAKKKELAAARAALAREK